MDLTSIVEQILQDGYLTPEMQAELLKKAGDFEAESVDDYIALDKLMSFLVSREMSDSDQQ